MSNRQFDREEQAFIKAVGLDSDNLEWLVQDAPAVSEESTRRVLDKTRLKIAIAPLTAQEAARRRAFRLPRWAAAAAAVLVICGATVTLSPSVQAALKSLIQLIPGFGVTEVAPEHLVLASPVSVAYETRKMTVTGIHGTETETILQLQWDGLSKTATVEPDYKPGVALVLPDGSRIDRKELFISGQAGTGKLLLKLTFPPLPAGTRSVRLELPELFGQTNPVGALLTLSPAGSAQLTQATPVNVRDQREGVALSVSHLAMDGDRIRLVAKTDPTDPRILAAAPDLMQTQPGLLLTLRDDLGKSYPLLWDETALSMNDGSSRTITDRGSSMWFKLPTPTYRPLTRTSPAFTAVFAGPVQPGAKWLTLTLLRSEVVEAGSASFSLDPGRLTRGQWLDLHQTLQVGAHQIVIEQMALWLDGSATIRLAATNERPDYISVLLGGKPVNGMGSSDRGTTWTAEAKESGISPEAPVEIKIDHLRFSVVGPWSVEVPLP